MPETHDATWLRQVARLVGGDPATVEDIRQETLLRRLERPPREEAGAHAWLARVASNLAISLWRTRARQTALLAHAPVPEPESTPEQQVAAQELERKLGGLVAALPPELGQVLSLRFEEELDSAQIGARLGISAATARWRLMKALDHLRAGLDEAPARGPRSRLRAFVLFPWWDQLRSVAALPSVWAPTALVAAASVAWVVGGVRPPAEPPVVSAVPAKAAPVASSPALASSPPAPAPAPAPAPEPRGPRPIRSPRPKPRAGVSSALALAPTSDPPQPERLWLVEGRGPAGPVTIEQNARGNEARLLAAPGVASLSLREAVQAALPGTPDPVTLCPLTPAAGSPCLPLESLSTDAVLAAITPDGMLRLKRWLPGDRVRAMARAGGRLRVPLRVHGREALSIDWPVVFDPGPGLTFVQPHGDGPILQLEVELQQDAITFQTRVWGQDYTLVVPKQRLGAVRITSRGGDAEQIFERSGPFIGPSRMLRQGPDRQPFRQGRSGDAGWNGGAVHARLRCQIDCAALAAQVRAVLASEGGRGSLTDLASVPPLGVEDDPGFIPPDGPPGRPGPVTVEVVAP
jgi:RNA polymerase sigma-70 factor (ECF subfamily)